MPAGGSEERSDEEPARRAQRAERSEAIPAQREKKKKSPRQGQPARGKSVDACQDGWKVVTKWIHKLIR